MRKIRAEIRMIPDTILKLIKTLGTTYEQGRKLTNAEVVSIAVAKLMGTYVATGDGHYLYNPQYEVCPDCSGLIEIADYLNPPPNDEANVEVWKAIKRQHVARCTWVTMAMNGKFSSTPVRDYLEEKKIIKPKKSSNVIEMKHNTVEPKIEVRQEGDELITEDQTEIQVEDIKSEIPAEIKPSLDSVDFEGENTEEYIDEFGGVAERVIGIKKKEIVDNRDTKDGILTDPKYKDKDAMSVKMTIGDTMGSSKNAEFDEQMGSRESVQGKVTEKNLDDKTMVIKTTVKGTPPDILLDKKSGDIVEKRVEDAKPIRVAKARVNKSGGTYQSLDEMPFD